MEAQDGDPRRVNPISRRLINCTLPLLGFRGQNLRVRVLGTPSYHGHFAASLSPTGLCETPQKPGQPAVNPKSTVESRGRVCFGHRWPRYGDKP